MRADSPRVAVSARAHLTSRGVKGATLAIGALSQITGPGGREVEAWWRRFIQTVLSWTLVFGYREPRGVVLTNVGVRAGSVGALVRRASIEEVIATRLQRPRRPSHGMGTAK